MENLPQSLSIFKCRKVITCECPCINDLSIGTSSYLNVEITNPPKVWVSCFLSVERNRISALAIMEKLKNGCNFINMHHMEKFQITDPTKFSVGSVSPSLHHFILGSVSTFKYDETFIQGHTLKSP